MLFSVSAVADDMHLFEGDQPPAQHILEGRQHAAYLLLTVNNLDNNGEVLGEAQDGVAVNKTRVCAKTLCAMQYRGPGEAFLLEEFHECVGERAAVPAVALTNEDAHQDLFTFHRFHSAPRR